jgi:hypothetical protein
MSNQLSLSQEIAVRSGIRTALANHFTPDHRSYQKAVCLGIDPEQTLLGDGSVKCVHSIITGGEDWSKSELNEFWTKTCNFPMSSFVDRVIEGKVVEFFAQTDVIKLYGELEESNMDEDWTQEPRFANFLFDETINGWSEDAIDDSLFNASAELIDAVVEGDDDRLVLLKNQVTCLRFLQQDVLTTCGESPCFQGAMNCLVWSEDNFWFIDA